MSNTLLIVDDDESVLRSLLRTLDDSQMKILFAKNGQEALALFERNTIDVLLTDHQMPGMSGLELLSTVKNISPDTVRIMITGYADLTTAINAINTGEVYKFIVKPWDNDELISILQTAMGRARLVQSLKHADEPTLRALAETIELKDHYTRGHCDRVAAFAQIIAEGLSFSDEKQQHIKHGAWLHDCGKIGVEEAILNSTEPLEEREWDIIRAHPIWGADVVSHAELHPMVVNVVHYHHERYDGKGYPAGLKGEEIPIEARIVAVADVFDAITTDRSYRKKLSKEKAAHILLSQKGKQLDAKIVDLFVRDLGK